MGSSIAMEPAGFSTDLWGGVLAFGSTALHRM
jgi:hypothetical protein